MSCRIFVLEPLTRQAKDKASTSNSHCMFRSPKLRLQVPPTALRSPTVLESKGSHGQRATSTAVSHRRPDLGAVKSWQRLTFPEASPHRGRPVVQLSNRGAPGSLGSRHRGLSQLEGRRRALSVREETGSIVSSAGSLTSQPAVCAQEVEA